MRNSTQSLKRFSRFDLWLNRRVYSFHVWLGGIGGFTFSQGLVQGLLYHKELLGAIITATGILIFTLGVRSIIVHWRIVGSRYETRT